MCKSKEVEIRNMQVTDISTGDKQQKRNNNKIAEINHCQEIIDVKRGSKVVKTDVGTNTDPKET